MIMRWPLEFANWLCERALHQSKLLLGEDDDGAREHLLTFVGSELVAVRWKQFRAYFADVAPGRSGASGAVLMGGVGASAAPMNGYPQVFNIEADPQEEHKFSRIERRGVVSWPQSLTPKSATLLSASQPTAHA